MISTTEVPALHPQVATRSIEGQALVVLADAGEVAILNESGTLLWEMVDGQHTVAELAATLASEYGLGKVDAEQDTIEFLETLLELHAIATERA